MTDTKEIQITPETFNKIDLLARLMNKTHSNIIKDVFALIDMQMLDDVFSNTIIIQEVKNDKR
jgi:hypothetical protein